MKHYRVRVRYRTAANAANAAHDESGWEYSWRHVFAQEQCKALAFARCNVMDNVLNNEPDSECVAVFAEYIADVARVSHDHLENVTLEWCPKNPIRLG